MGNRKARSNPACLSSLARAATRSALQVRVERVNHPSPLTLNLLALFSSAPLRNSRAELHVILDRSRPVWTCSPEVAAGYNKIKTWVAMSDAMYEKYQKPPGPVDFASAKKKVRDVELVDMLESLYKSSKPPPETFAQPESEKKAVEETLSYLKDLDALHKDFLPVLDKEIEFYESVRTDENTTCHDMRANYPLIHEEIEDELERREWFKDTEYEAGSGGK